MSKGMKRMVLGSMGASALVGLSAIVDIIAGIPFAGKIMLDATFIVSAGLIGYMGWETIKEGS